ncbi:MAG: alanine racemase [Clostridia bacterium]|nr:alanine racemase [Clostridia bacterium]MBR6573544.1 alanine racemase [Clostridia bacterium]
MEHLRSTRAEINLDNLKYNIDRCREEIGPDVEPMAIIKADCYGHGAVVMMEYMMKYGIRYFGVASLNEALELRRFHKEGEVLVLGLSSDYMLKYGVDNNITQACCSLRQAKLLSEYATAEKKAKIQIKVDTGMHRLGFAPTEESMDIVKEIASLPNLDIVGVFSHLALETKEDDYRQWKLFQQFIDGCEARGVTFPFKSINDGIGTIRYPEMRYNMVRPGSFFYGFNPHLSDLKPLMELKSEIVHLQVLPANEGIGYGLDDAADHDRIIATLPFGYVDGVPRAMSHYQGWTSVKGVKCPFVGLLCMDQAMIDVTDVPDVAIGDEVVVFSANKGGMTYPEGAKISNFNRNGLQAALPRRVPKVYFENGVEVAYRDYLFDKE